MWGMKHPVLAFLLISSNRVSGSGSNTTTNKTSPASPAEGMREWLVENTSKAQALAAALNCSGGTFAVEWKGNITVDTEIVVTNGTVLTITGSVGHSAVLDGGGRTRLFRVVNASLELNDVRIRNGNAAFGGAIAATSSILTLNQTHFSRNEANNENGGAMFVDGGSNVSFVGTTTFSNNSSNNYGGALYVVNSSVSWNGASTISENRALYSGGALYVVNGSSVSWAGETTFEGNSARDVSGGGLYLEGDSNALWNAPANFLNNSAGYEGGAIFVDLGSNASWSGGANFSDNTAHSGGGGAMLIAHSSTVMLSRDTAFSENRCNAEGGAVSSRALDWSSSITSGNAESSLVVNGAIHFTNNTCGTNGGGLAMLGELSLSLKTGSVTFIENTAKIAGGGVFILSTGACPVFTNASFQSNSAEAGGGVSIVGCGISFDSQGEKLPVTFDECTFTGNKAGVTGGAIESAYGVNTTVTTTSFKGNEAGFSGGALRLAGDTSLNECTFEDNISGLDGAPAISIVGSSSNNHMENLEFRDNAYDCDAGTFLNESGSGNRFAVVCSGCNGCDNCTIEKSTSLSTCSPVIEHSTTPYGRTATLTALLIEPGYWRATNDSTNILACYNSDACNGGLTGSLSFCSEGYNGPYCAVCTDGYFQESDFTCTKCSENVWGLVVAAVAVIVAVVVAFAGFKYLISTKRAEANPGITARFLHRVPLHSVKIIIVAWQILTQFSAAADVTYPGIYQRFLDVMDGLNFDPSWMLSAGCLVNVDFHGRLLVVTVGPILAMLMLSRTYSSVVRRPDASEEIVEIARHKHVSAGLFIMFVVYTSASSLIFQMFDCDSLDDGNDYLRADYTIRCDGPKHKALVIFAQFMIPVYPLGIPAVFAFLLFRNRRILLDNAAREDSSEVRSISDLWEPYKPSRFYYEIIECGRRIVLMGVVMVVDGDSAAQIAVTLVLAIIFTVISEGLAPYESQMDTWVCRLAHVVVVFSVYYALLLKVNISNDSQYSQRVFEAMLILIHLFMIIMAIAEATLAGCSGCVSHKGQVEDELPRCRSDLSQRFRNASRSALKTVPLSDYHLGDSDIEEPLPQPAGKTSSPRSECDVGVAPLKVKPVPERSDSVC